MELTRTYQHPPPTKLSSMIQTKTDLPLTSLLARPTTNVQSEHCQAIHQLGHIAVIHFPVVLHQYIKTFYLFCTISQYLHSTSTKYRAIFSSPLARRLTSYKLRILGDLKSHTAYHRSLNNIFKG